MTKKQGFNLKLERYLLGELPPAEMAAVEGELKKNKSLRLQLEHLKEETAAYYRKYPGLNRVQATESWFKILFTPRTIGGLAFAAACIAAVLYFPRENPKTDD